MWRGPSCWRIGALVLGAVCATLGACTPEIPGGIYACDDDGDCPQGFSCQVDPHDAAGREFCYAGKGHAGGSGGSDGSLGGRGGADGGGRGGRDATADGGVPPADAGPDGGGATPRVPPSSGGFSTVGTRRSGGGITVYDDGFELGSRRCTSDGKLCVTGGFSP